MQMTVIGGAGRAPGATSGSDHKRHPADAEVQTPGGSRDGAPQPRWLATSVVARALVASFSTAALDLENLALIDVLWIAAAGAEEQRIGTVMSTGSGMTASLFPRHSRAFVGRAPWGLAGSAISRQRAGRSRPSVADARTRVPKRSWPGDQGAASPRRPSRAFGLVP